MDRIREGLRHLQGQLDKASGECEAVPWDLPYGAFGWLPESQRLLNSHYYCALELRGSLAWSSANLRFLESEVTRAGQAYERTELDSEDALEKAVEELMRDSGGRR